MSMNKPLVSIIIPTLNSGSTLELCLRSILNQAEQNIEIIVVDGYSNDSTVNIAKRYNVKVYFERSLLGARVLGLKYSYGNYTLMLDSDQILESTCIDRALKMMAHGFDALILEEFSFHPKTFVQKLYSVDRQLVHKSFDSHPVHGVLLPRFYKRDVLEKAVRNIPQSVLNKAIAYDHAVISYETSKITDRIGLLTNALYHLEDATMRELFEKFYRYGQSARWLSTTEYARLLARKMIPRKGVLNPLNLHWSIPSMILYFLKAVPFFLGYVTGVQDEASKQFG